MAPLKGHEFHRACSNIGGEFIQISPASQNCINVMAIRKVDRSVDAVSYTHLISQHYTSLVSHDMAQDAAADY